MRTAVACLSIIFIPASAAASDWMSIEKGADKEIFLDADSVSKQGDVLQAWNKTVYSQGELKERRALILIRCDQSTWAFKMAVEYGRDGQLISSKVQPDFELAWTPVVPETVGANTVGSACALWDLRPKG